MFQTENQIGGSKLKIKRLCLIGGMLLLCLSFFVSCGKEKENPDNGSESVLYTVSFDCNGGTEIAPMQVTAGSKITRPEDPERENYVFNGWAKNGVDWDFESDKVTSDMTLKAKWIAADSLFTYTPSEDGSYAIITGHTTEVKKMLLPSSMKGLPVRAIAASAFADLSSENVLEIILPEEITIIGEKAFENCSGISITVKGLLSMVGEGAFLNCDKLANVSFSEELTTIPYEAFSGCTSLTSLVLPKSLTTISENAFDDCSGVQTVICHAALTTIEDSAFRECTALKTVFFYGSAEELEELRNAVSSLTNQSLANAKFYRYSEQKPTEDGNWWHFDVNGNPRIWG